MKPLSAVLLATLPGLVGLGIGGYFFFENVIARSASGAGPDACAVATADIARHVLGGSARRIDHFQGDVFTACTCYGGGLFLRVEVAGWDVISSNISGSGHPNQGTGPGTYLLNTSVSQDSTLATGSWLGRVTRKGDIGAFVTAGHYGQFFGNAAIRELALEDRLERKAVVQVRTRL